jgi:hypothetical protein
MNFSLRSSIVAAFKLPSKVECEGCTYAIHVLYFRAPVVLPHVVKIQNDLALGQQRSSKGTTLQ